MADRIHPAAASPSAPILEESKRLNGAYVQSSAPAGAAGAGGGGRGAYPPHPASYRPPKNRRSRGCGICCRCIGWLIALLVLIVVLLGITALVFWLVLRPVKSPDYNVQDVSIQTLTVDPTANPPSLSSLIAFTVRAENPNKKIGIYYDKVDIFLFYDGMLVGDSSIDPFYQGHRNTTFLQSNLTTTNLPISTQLATSLRDDIGNQNVPFDIRVRVKARVKIGALKSPKVKVRANCKIHVSPPSAPSGARLLDKRCKVRVRL